MKKFIILLLLQIGLVTALYAQHVVNSAAWQLLNTFSIKTQNNKYVLYFPPDLKAMGNKVIELPGYMVPLKVGKQHKEFMLSVLPVQQCAFCGSGDYPPMVLVKADRPVTYTDKAMTIKGKLILNELGGVDPEFSLINASIKP